MKRVACCFSVLVFGMSLLLGPGVSAQATGDPLPSSHIIAGVPYHAQQNDHWCGYACLEMVFDYYGADIPQQEIISVEGMSSKTSFPGFFSGFLPEAQFSRLSTSHGTYQGHQLTGYVERGLGYAAFRQSNPEPWLDQLKVLVASDRPVMVHQWFDLSATAPHWRLVIGYDDVNQEMILHDPWDRGQSGYAPGEMSANERLSYADFTKLWSCTADFDSPYNAVLVVPWSVQVSVPSVVAPGSTFTVTATVQYPCPAPFDKTQFAASLSKATISIPSSLKLSGGERLSKTIAVTEAGSTAKVTWKLVAPRSAGVCDISVEASGLISGIDASGQVYQDSIGGIGASTVAFSR